MRDSQISKIMKKCLIVSKELLFLKGMYTTTYIFEKLWRFHVISHQVCRAESDFSADFRVIGCSHGAEISSFMALEIFLGSLDPLSQSLFWSLLCPQKCQNSDKMCHPWVSQEHIDFFYATMGADFMGWIYIRVMHISATKWDRS